MNETKRVLLELMWVSGVGLAVGLTANAMNNKGLLVGYDYFRPIRAAATQASAGSNRTSGTTTTSGENTNARQDNPLPGSQPTVDPYVQAVLDEGLQVITHDEVVEVFRDPEYEEYTSGEFVFVDARNDALYREGHIPGAYQWDHYRRERLTRYIEEIIPVCMGAQKVIAYCEGGDCEDSRFVAGDLLEHGVDPARVFVYVGGMAEWKKHPLDIELGERLSGRIVCENHHE